jgi:hypothetical protein
MNEQQIVKMADSFPVDVAPGTHAMVAKGYAAWEERRGIINLAHLSSGARRRANNRIKRLAGKTD